MADRGRAGPRIPQDLLLAGGIIGLQQQKLRGEGVAQNSVNIL